MKYLFRVLLLTVAPMLSAQSFKVIYTFPNLASGEQPVGAPYIDPSGVLYGATATGGGCALQSYGCGTLFSLTPPSQTGAAWTENVLYSFQGTLDGLGPSSGVLPGPAGSLIATTAQGGLPQLDRCHQGCGTLLQLNPPTQPGGVWTEQILYDYIKANFEPGAVLPGSNGVYFGASEFGEGRVCNSGCGSIYELLPPVQPGGPWSVDEIHLFHQSDGAYPFPTSRLVVGPNGVLYGTTSTGGDFTCTSWLGCGVVFSLSPPVSPGTPWTFHDIYKFKDPRDGDEPIGGLVVGTDGTLYGTTSGGGMNACLRAFGCGTVFSLTPPATGTGQWTKTILHSFQGGDDGWNPLYAMVLGSGGVLYGVTSFGGGSACSGQGCGVLFQLTPPAVAGGAWTETILHAFTRGSDGFPSGPPALDANGILYGYANGDSGTGCDGFGCGVVYQYIP